MTSMYHCTEYCNKWGMIQFNSFVVEKHFTYPLTIVSSQSFDFQHLCSLKKTTQLFLAHIHFPSIHELQQSLQVLVCNIFQDYNWVFARIYLNANVHLVKQNLILNLKGEKGKKNKPLQYLKQGLEIRATDRQNNLVCLKESSICSQCNVN